MYDVDLAAVGALLGNPSRALMLDALMTGRSLTATELAKTAGVSAATASEHLMKLRQGGLVEAVAQGRHRYHRLAGPDVGAALESLSFVAPAKPVRTLRQSARARSLAQARTCYDHLAGAFAVRLHDVLLEQDWVRPRAGVYEVTGRGAGGLASWGVDIVSARAARRPLLRPCLDWTERTCHLAGSAAAAIATTLIDGPEPWFVRRSEDHRGLRITDLGRCRLEEIASQAKPATARALGPDPCNTRSDAN